MVWRRFSACVLLLGCGRVAFDARGDATAGDGVRDAVGPAWPNEPLGFTALTDHSWDALGSQGWNHNPCESRIVVDETAPYSPASVLEHPFPTGFQGDRASCIDFYALPGLDELYVGIWWKVSDPWQGADLLSNNIGSVAPPNGGSTDFGIRGAGSGPFVLRLMLGAVDNTHVGATADGWLPDNAGDGTVVLGAWHQLEIYVRRSTDATSRDGIARWWMDGRPIGAYANVNFEPQNYIEVSIKTYWSVSVPKAQDDFHRFDHVHVSAP